MTALFLIFATFSPFAVSARSQARGPSRLQSGGAISPTSVTNEAHTTRDLFNTNVNLDIGTCVRLTESFNLTQSLSDGSDEVSAALKTGDCICVDASGSAGTGGGSAGVDVVTSGGYAFDGDVAAGIAEAVSPNGSIFHC